MDIPTFRAAYPVFANTTSFPDAVITQAISDADAMLDSTAWGGLTDPRYLKAEGLLVAHFTVLATAAGTTLLNGITGTMTSKMVGQVQTQYAVSQRLLQLAADNPFYLTIFGRQYLYLLETSGPFAVAV